MIKMIDIYFLVFYFSFV